MTKAYSYIRMSTAEQIKGNSDRRQTKLSEDYARNHGLDLIELDKDVGVSAFKGDNSKFGPLADFLAGIQDGTIEIGSYLIIESLDRLSREVVLEALGLLSSIINAGIIVVTLADNQVLSKEVLSEEPERLMMALIIMMRAHEESKMKSHRLKSVWSKKRDDMQSGKVSNQRLPAWIEFSDDKTELQPIGYRVELIKEMFLMSRDGYGAYSIARKLNSRSVKTWGKSKFWYESYIKKILHNRSVLGEFQPMRFSNDQEKKVKAPVGDPVQNYYPRIIDPALFTASQAAISRRRLNGAGRKGTGNHNVFTGLIKCGLCGTGYRYLNKGTGPKGGKYLQCSESHLNGNCNAPAWRYRHVEIAIIQAVEQLDFGGIISDASSASEQLRLAAIEHELVEELTTLETQINNFADFIGKHGSDQNIDQKYFDAQQERTEKQRQLESVRQSIVDDQEFEPARIEQSKAAILNMLRSDDLKQNSEPLKRKLYAELRVVLSHITLQPDDVDLLKMVERKPKWFQSFELSYGEFEKKAKRFAFELGLHYRNGAAYLYKPIGHEKIPLDLSN